MHRIGHHLHRLPHFADVDLMRNGAGLRIDLNAQVADFQQMEAIQLAEARLQMLGQRVAERFPGASQTGSAVRPEFGVF